MLQTAVPTFVVCLLLAVMAWVWGRPRKWLLPSDTFFIVTFLVVGITPLLNLRAENVHSIHYAYSDADISRALYGLSIMFAIFAVIWAVRPRLAPTELFPPKNDSVGHSRFLAGCMATAIIAGLLTLAYPSYLQYKLQSLSFIFGHITNANYQLARRVTYANDPFIGGFIGRLRYSIFAFLYTASIVFAASKFRIGISAIIAALLFILLGASMSKAPLFIYLSYFLIAALTVSGRTNLFRARNFLFLFAAGLSILFLVLCGAYYLQYRQTFSSIADLPDVSGLVFYRMFVATYDGLLGFFTVYPNVYSFAYGTGSSLISALIGVEPRVLDTEVPNFIFHRSGSFTSFPTVFVGNAYASFGYLGVIAYSVVVGIFAVAIDHIVLSIRSRSLRICLYATLCVNITYFSALSATTVLFTYGCAIIPLLVFIADRALSRAQTPGQTTDRKWRNLPRHSSRHR